MSRIRQANNESSKTLDKTQNNGFFKTLIEFDEPLNVFSEDRVYKIPLDNIIPCPFEPQARRRATFKQEDLESLGDSIVADSLLSPIVVRPNGGNLFEIVFGERRFLASKLKNLAHIKCFVRELSDTQVLKLQYKENHERKENTPLNDAFTFRFLIKKENYSIDDLANEFNLNQKKVIDLLKLNDLIAEAAAELESKILPLRHAVYMSKFPGNVQKEIHDEQLAYRYYDREHRATSYEQFVEEISHNILLRLTDAPFSTIDPRLHIKGLICPDCTERTGYAPMLFPDLTTDDSCLNKTCFKFKTEMHLTLQRDAIAARMPNPENKPVTEIAKAVPLVTEKRYTDENSFKEKTLTNQKLQEIPECESSVLSLAVEGEKKGQMVYTCRNEDCPVHRPKPTPDDARKLPIEKLEQLENDFNVRVARSVRIKTLSLSLIWFDDYKSFWTFDDSIKKLIVECLFNFGLQHAHILLPVLRQNFKDAPKNLHDKEQIQIFADSLDKRAESQILFLLSVISADDELEVLKIATDYTKADYLLLDATARFELAPTEFKSVAAEYLDALKSGNSASVPQFWLNFDDVKSVSEEEN